MPDPVCQTLRGKCSSILPCIISLDALTIAEEILDNCIDEYVMGHGSEINIHLKDEQKEFLDQLIIDHSLTNMEASIQSLVNKILDNHDHEDVFGEIRCVGGCFSTDETISVELDDEYLSKMKEIFKKFEFEDYDSEDEELSKIVRSIINYADQEADIENFFS